MTARHWARVVSVAATAAATLSFATPASAIDLPPTPGDHHTCSFTLGVALTPSIPPLGLSSPTHTSGTFVAGGGGTCVKVDADPDDTANTKVYAIQIQSTGNFASRTCGSLLTLSATELANTEVTSADPGWEGPVVLSYRMDFAGSPGVAAGTGPILVLRARNEERDTGINGAGTAVAVTGGGNCTIDGFWMFGIEGSFSFVI